MKKKLFGTLITSFIAVSTIGASNLNASELQADLSTSNQQVDTYSTQSSTYGWYYGSLGYCDQNGDDVMYTKNTSAGGRTYQKAGIDTDAGPYISQTKNKSTAEVSDGAHSTYKSSWSDYN